MSKKIKKGAKVNHLVQGLILDHVAVAVSDLDKAQLFYEQLGLIFSATREVVPSQAVTTAFAKIDENAQLELLCPYGDDQSGPIHQFIAKKGEGIHHLCFKVQDIEKKCHELRALGVKLLYETARVGAHGCLVNFIHPKSSGGVLIELSQPPLIE